MEIDRTSAVAFLPGDICVRERTGEAESRVRHAGEGDVWLSPLGAGPDLIAPASECRLARAALKERLDAASSNDEHAAETAPSTPTFPDGTKWP